MEHFFPRIRVETCAQMQTRVKLLERDAQVDHTQIIGGDTVKLLGDISPQSPRVSAPLVVAHIYPPVTGQRPTLTIGRFAQFSLH